MTRRVLVACVGNIFLGDDAFGVEVARRLAERPQPEGVRVVDFGIRGLDLAYALVDGYDAAILIDAVPRGGVPGALYVIEPELDGASGQAGAGVETHNVDPQKVLALVGALGKRPGKLYVVGCEPMTFGPEEGHMGLSPPVGAAVEEAVGLVEGLVGEILDGESTMAARERQEARR